MTVGSLGTVQGSSCDSGESWDSTRVYSLVVTVGSLGTVQGSGCEGSGCDSGESWDSTMVWL